MVWGTHLWGYVFLENGVSRTLQRLLNYVGNFSKGRRRFRITSKRFVLGVSVRGIRPLRSAEGDTTIKARIL